MMDSCIIMFGAPILTSKMDAQNPEWYGRIEHLLMDENSIEDQVGFFATDLNVDLPVMLIDGSTFNNLEEEIDEDNPYCAFNGEQHIEARDLLDFAKQHNIVVGKVQWYVFPLIY